jgi:hypothetical protein
MNEIHSLAECSSFFGWIHFTRWLSEAEAKRTCGLATALAVLATSFSDNQ